MKKPKKVKKAKCEACGNPIRIIPTEIVVGVNYNLLEDGVVNYDMEYMNEEFQKALEGLPYQAKEKGCRL